MRIAITGTHGTGKTTLARALSERLGVPMIEEVARSVIKRYGFRTTSEYIKKADAEMKKIIQTDILNEQMMREGKHDSFISDRSVFDAVAYAEVYSVDRGRINRMIGEAIAHALNTYDLLVYVPPVLPLKDDGFRDLNQRLRAKVCEILRCKYIEIMGTLGMPVLILWAVDLEERVKEVLSLSEWVAKVQKNKSLA